MKNLKTNFTIIADITWIAAAVTAGIPTFFALVCYLSSWAQTDCGWFALVPTFAMLGAISGFLVGCWMVYRTSKPWDFSTKRMQGRIQSHRFNSCELGCFILRGTAHSKEYIINTPIFALSVFVSDKGWRTAGK